MPTDTLSAASALGFGLGDMLGQQRNDETEDERKRRLLGLSTAAKNSGAAQQLFGYGQTGIAPMAPLSLGLAGGRRF